MRLRNDTGAPVHIPPTDLGPAVLVQAGDEIDYPAHVAGLTPVDHEFVDGDWRPIETPPARPARPVKPAAGDTGTGTDAAEEVQR